MFIKLIDSKFRTFEILILENLKISSLEKFRNFAFRKLGDLKFRIFRISILEKLTNFKFKTSRILILENRLHFFCRFCNLIFL